MDVSSTRKLKYVFGFCFLTVLGLQAAANPCGTKEEVVSIYGPDFTTPASREPYFIRIQRCIFSDLSTIIWNSSKYQKRWSFPVKRKEVVIVVPDINNKKKFYKYVVYNDTDCECKHQNNFTQHKSFSQISATDFNSNVSMNPKNIRTCNKFSYCNKPQPRYLINPLGNDSKPHHRYILHHECLPGCRTTKRTMIRDKFENIQGQKIPHSVSDAKNCSPYVQTTGKAGRLTNRKSSSHGPLKASNEKKLQDEMIIYIGSTKLLLAAFVLSTILLSILILDCNLWHRKKGILYNILCYRKYKAEINHRAERRQERIEV